MKLPMNLYAHLSDSDQEKLRTRAKMLAQTDQKQPAEPPLEVMVVRLGQAERYALPLSSLVQVIQTAVFPLPGVPSEIAGMLSWHGQMICVLEAAHLLGLNASTIETTTRVILLSSPHGLVALQVAEILELASFAPSSLGPPMVGRLAVQAIYAGHTALLEPAQLWERVMSLVSE